MEDLAKNTKAHKNLYMPTWRHPYQNGGTKSYESLSYGKALFLLHNKCQLFPTEMVAGKYTMLPSTISTSFLEWGNGTEILWKNESRTTIVIFILNLRPHVYLEEDTI